MTGGIAVGVGRGLSVVDSVRLGAAAGALNVSRRGLGTGRRADRALLRPGPGPRVRRRPGRLVPGGTVRVLVTNDDGIDSAGLAVFARTAVDAGCEVMVAAPARESSGTSASLVGAELDGRLIIDEKANPDLRPTTGGTGYNRHRDRRHGRDRLGRTALAGRPRRDRRDPGSAADRQARHLIGPAHRITREPGGPRVRRAFGRRSGQRDRDQQHRHEEARDEVEPQEAPPPRPLAVVVAHRPERRGVRRVR